MPGYVMNQELKRTVQQVCLQFLNSFQPRPKRGRRARRGGGGGGGGGGVSSLVWARVTIKITSADGPEVWGGGTVQLQDSETGELSVDETVVDNLWIDEEWPVDAQVLLDTSHETPRVVTGKCEPVSWG